MSGGADWGKRWQGDARLAICGVVAWVWLWRWVDPSRAYDNPSLSALPSFGPDAMFARANWSVIGGPLQQASEWLSQLWHWSAAATTLLVASALAVAAGVDRAASSLAGRRLPGLRYAPFLLCLLLDGHYMHLLDWQIGWAAALFAVSAELSWSESRPAVRAAVLLPAAGLVYYVLGGPALIAVPLAAFGEGRRRETRLLAGALATSPLWLPALAQRAAFDHPLAQVYEALLPRAVGIDQYGVVRSAALGMIAFGVLVGAVAVRPAQPRAPRPALAWLAPVVTIALMFAVGRDRVDCVRMQLGQLAARRDWTGLLAAAKQLAPQELIQFDDYHVLLALAHTGQVGERLFEFGLPTTSILRDDPRLGGGEVVRRMRTQHGVMLRAVSLELGLVNEAEHELHETLETQGTYPALLVPMARVQIMKGRPEAARVLLRLAAAQPGDPAGAAPLLRALTADPRLASDPVQAGLERNRMQGDVYYEQRLMPLLEQVTSEHPGHRLAQEYLLALYLLDNQLDRLVAALPTLPDPARDTLPRHIEEALLCQEVLTGRPVPLGRWTIRGETRSRFDDYIRALGCGRDGMVDYLRTPRRPPRAAAKVLGSPWSDTYYYYRMFGMAGVAR